MTARPRAAVFDAYGTLLDIHSAVGRHAGRLGQGAGAVSALWRAKQLEATWILSATGDYKDFAAITEAALAHALAVHGIDDEDLRRDLLQAYHALDAFPDALSSLAALRAAGIPTAILSNGEPGMLTDAVAVAKLAPLLDAVLSVHPLRLYKPHPAVYALATDRFACQPHEVAFVSANAWDAYGASRFGFRPLWVNRGGGPAEYGLDETGTILPSLASLPDHLIP